MENLTTYFKDNPSLKLAVVTTVSGIQEYRVNCKKIKDGYYIMNSECYEVNQKWYRLNSGLIEYDNELKAWVLKGKTLLINGIIDFNAQGPVFGMFSANPYNNANYYSPMGSLYPCISTQVLIAGGKMEDFSTGLWHDVTPKNVKVFQTPRNALDHTAKGYNIEDNIDEYATKIKLYNEYKMPLSKNVNIYGKMLGNTTFGVEIECSHGNLPEFIQNRTGVVTCRDGSLKDENGVPGPEFVTIPLSGTRGLQTVSTLGTELTKRTSLNLNCSLHIHYGTLPTSRAYLVTLYKLCLKIQDEIFTMFPYYKANPDGIKNKNYNQKLPMLSMRTMRSSMCKEDFDETINTSYKRIFSWLADGYVPDISRNRKNKRHPASAKWDRHARYYWINFMNTIFSERNTLEFRLHTPTTNSQKMVNWLFICNAILKYAMTHSRKILFTGAEITLNEVLDYYNQFGKNGEFLADYLQEYVAQRKAAFLRDYLAGDKISSWDYLKDSDYVFKFNNITNLF